MFVVIIDQNRNSWGSTDLPAPRPPAPIIDTVSIEESKKVKRKTLTHIYLTRL